MPGCIHVAISSFIPYALKSNASRKHVKTIINGFDFFLHTF